MFLLFLSALQMHQVSLNLASNRKVGLLIRVCTNGANYTECDTSK